MFAVVGGVVLVNCGDDVFVVYLLFWRDLTLLWFLRCVVLLVAASSCLSVVCYCLVI